MSLGGSVSGADAHSVPGNGSKTAKPAPCFCCSDQAQVVCVRLESNFSLGMLLFGGFPSHLAARNLIGLPERQYGENHELGPSATLFGTPELWDALVNLEG